MFQLRAVKMKILNLIQRYILQGRCWRAPGDFSPLQHSSTGRCVHFTRLNWGMDIKYYVQIPRPAAVVNIPASQTGLPFGHTVVASGATGSLPSAVL